jgi:hypothetical protein
MRGSGKHSESRAALTSISKGDCWQNAASIQALLAVTIHTAQGITTPVGVR